MIAEGNFIKFYLPASDRQLILTLPVFFAWEMKQVIHTLYPGYPFLRLNEIITEINHFSLDIRKKIQDNGQDANGHFSPAGVIGTQGIHRHLHQEINGLYHVLGRKLDHTVLIFPSEQFLLKVCKIVFFRLPGIQQSDILQRGQPLHEPAAVSAVDSVIFIITFARDLAELYCGIH